MARTARIAIATLAVAGVRLVGACSTFGSEGATSAPPDQSDGGVPGVPGQPATPPIVLSYNGPPVVQTGTTADVTISVVRDGLQGFGGTVTIALDPTAGVAALPVTIPPSTDHAVVRVTVDPSRKHGRVDLVFVGTTEGSLAKGVTTYTPLIRGPVGSVDTSFGKDGVFTLDESSAATGLVVEASRMLVGGRIGSDIGVAAVDFTGTLDPTFGSSGVARVTVSGLVETTELVEDTNALYLAGSTSSGAVVASFDGKGGVGTFGGAGLASAPLATASSIALSPAVALPRGIMVAGRKSAAAADSDVVLVQLDGTLSTQFGDRGLAHIANTCGGSTDPGKCVAKGLTVLSSVPSIAVCAELNPFSTIAVQSYSVDDAASLLSTSPYLSSCQTLASAGTEMFVAGTGGTGQAGVLHSVGSSIDTTWASGSAGAPTAVAPAGSNLTLAKKVLVQTDGTLLVAADAQSNGHAAFAVWRVTAAGKTDVAFNPPKGYSVSNAGTTDVTVTAMGVDADNRIVVAGFNGHMVVTRFWQ